MSLLRLLSAGKSLVGLKDSTARYRMGHPGAMPKFGSAKNPFQTKRQPLPAAAVTRAAPLAAAADSSPRSAPGCVREKKSGPAAGAPASKIQSRPANRNGSRLGSVIQSALHPLKSLLQRRPRSKPAGQPKKQSLRTPVQAELSLDCVKVLRNDLSDADLEVVSAKTTTPIPSKTEPDAQSQAMPEDAEQFKHESKQNPAANRLAGAGKL